MPQFTSRVKTSKYDKPYDKGDVHLHYYTIELENGTTAALGVKQRDDERTLVGSEITYDLINGQIKNSSLVSRQNGVGHHEQRSEAKPYNKFARNGLSKESSIIGYIGYAAGYSKDMVVAGKTTNKDIAAFKVIFRAMIEEIESVLNEKQAKQ